MSAPAERNLRCAAHTTAEPNTGPNHGSSPVSATGATEGTAATGSATGLATGPTSGPTAGVARRVPRRPLSRLGARRPAGGRVRATARAGALLPAPRRAGWAVLVTVVGALLGVLGTATQASAHAALTASDPAKDSVVSEAPRGVTLTFSEDVAMSDGSLQVLDPRGERVDRGTVKDTGGGEGGRAGGNGGNSGDGGDAVQRSVDLRSGLSDGTFTVVWRAVSADSHPVSGAFTFSIGAPSKSSADIPQQATGDGGSGAVGLLYDTARYVAYAGYTLLVGGAAFVLLCWRAGARAKSAQRTTVLGWLGLATATFVMLLLRHPYTGSGELSDALDLDGLRTVIQTTPGAAMLSRLLLLAVAALGLAVLFGAHPRAATPAEESEQPAESKATEETEETARAGADAGRPEGAVRRAAASRGETDVEGAAPARLPSHGADPPRTPSATDQHPADPDSAHRTTDEGSDRPATDGTGETPRTPDRSGRSGEAAPRRGVGVSWAAGLAGAAVAVGMAATWAIAEHASTGIQTSLAMPVHVVHLLAVAAWLGGLTVLLTTLYTGPPMPSAAVERFSRVAFGSVAVLAATGLYQSWRQVGSWSALTGTSYGQLLLVKVALVVVLVGVGWLSRRRVARIVRTPGTGAQAPATPPADRPTEPGTGPEERVAGPEPEAPADRGDAGLPRPRSVDTSETTEPGSEPEPGSGTERAAQLARQRAAVEAARRRRERDADPHRTALRRTVLLETAIAVLLLAVTTALTGTEPARTESAARDGSSSEAPARPGPVEFELPFDTGGSDGEGTASVLIEPGSTGKNTLHLRLVDTEGEPMDPPEVRIALSHPAKGPSDAEGGDDSGGSGGSGGTSIGPLSADPRPVSGEPGHWRATGVQLPVAGDWEVAVTIRTSDIDQVTETENVRIG